MNLTIGSAKDALNIEQAFQTIVKIALERHQSLPPK